MLYEENCKNYKAKLINMLVCCLQTCKFSWMGQAVDFLSPESMGSWKQMLLSCCFKNMVVDFLALK